MKRMAGSKVFLNGLGGVGVEIGNLFFSKDLINRIESLLNKSSLTSISQIKKKKSEKCFSCWCQGINSERHKSRNDTGSLHTILFATQ